MTDNETPDSRTVLVAYGSETGNSQDVADELGGLAERLHFQVHVCELDAVKAVRRMTILPIGDETLIYIAGIIESVLVGNIRCLHDGPGGFPRQFEGLLEISTSEKALSNLSSEGKFCTLRIGG